MRKILALLLLSALTSFGGMLINSYRYGVAVNLKTSLVSYYKLDESGGAVDATDVHGSKTLTNQSGPTSVTGKINTARAATTTNMYFTRADDTSFEPGSSQFFVTMWVKPSSLSQATSPSFFGKYTASGSQGEWTVLFVDASNTALFSVSANGSATTEVTASTAFPDTSTFVFIAAGWDGTNTKISVNGGAFVTAAFTGPVFAGTATINMFTRDNGAASFQGAIDEVAFWKGRCLTLTEVQSIYNSGTGLPYTSW